MLAFVVKGSLDRWSVFLVAAGATLWGTDTVLRRPLTESLPSSQIVLYEHLILTVVLLPVLLARRQEWLKLRPAAWTAILGIAWGGSALATLCFTEAVRLGNPTTVVLLQKLQPVFTILLANFWLRERLRHSQWLYLLMALGGALLVSFGGWPAPLRLNLEASLLALGAAALWGCSTVLGRYLSPLLSFPSLTALRIVVAAPLLLVIAARRGLFQRVNESQGLALAFMALVPGLAALLLYYRGLRHTPAPLASIAELCFPATTAALNWMILGASFTITQAVGFALIWAIVWALQISREKRQ